MGTHFSRKEREVALKEMLRVCKREGIIAISDIHPCRTGKYLIFKTSFGEILTKVYPLYFSEVLEVLRSKCDILVYREIFPSERMKEILEITDEKPILQLMVFRKKSL